LAWAGRSGLVFGREAGYSSPSFGLSLTSEMNLLPDLNPKDTRVVHTTWVALSPGLPCINLVIKRSLFALHLLCADFLQLLVPLFLLDFGWTLKPARKIGNWGGCSLFSIRMWERHLRLTIFPLARAWYGTKILREENSFCLRLAELVPGI